jgi:hypothetical protein
MRHFARRLIESNYDTAPSLCHQFRNLTHFLAFVQDGLLALPQ